MMNKIKVLVIEDEALIAENLKLTLEDLGYAVTDTCYTYVQALQQIEKRDADLVLLDINLSSRNAAESGMAIATLLQTKYKLPFIFLTAYNDLDTIRQATRLQPSGYLIKPVNNATLFAALQIAIENFITQRPLQLQTVQPPPDFFYVKLGTKAVKVLWSSVYCIETGKNYVKLRTTGAKSECAVRGSLQYVLENMVPPSLSDQFIRISRSTCLNKKYITGYDKEHVYCNNESFVNDRINLKELKALITG